MLSVEYTQYCTHDYHSGNRFGDWETRYQFSVTGVVAGYTPKINEQFALGIDVQPGEIVHVLSMEWSDGDSFGRAYGKGEVMWVFRDIELGMAARQSIETACRHNNGSHTFSFTSDDGRTIQLNNPAYGYFEHLECVSLQPFIVRAGSDPVN